MTFCVEVETTKESSLDYEEIFNRVASRALEMEGCPYEAEINLLITDDESIREMNAEFREIDRSTDVLSFPMLDYDIPGDFSRVEDEFADCFNPESGELMLGDIVISLDHVFEQADKYGHTIYREFAFLIAHSMLHLMGYDHMEADEAEVMFSKQEAVLHSLSIDR